MDTSNFINADTLDKQEKNEQQKVTDVYIGVFFDGTNNNMVQQAYFHTFKKDGVQSPSGEKIDTKSVLKQNNIWNTAIQKIQQKKEKTEELQSIYVEMGRSDSKNMTIPSDTIVKCKKLEFEIKELDEEIEKLQIETHLDINAMGSDTQQGYSNIAILHSLLQEKENKEGAIYYHIYVEGSGANDIVTSDGKTGLLNEGNINGLGFGLGNTGVTALVSKAVKYVYNYLNNYKSLLNSNTKYHFLVFGFSRGATCARLFTELTTREPGKTLPREKEFSQETSKVQHLLKDGRLPFMEKDFIKGVTIVRKNVTVDFLGIYDTVASIGFLKQKDGWTNALSWGYRIWWWNNYIGNFHYMNSHDYGLYSHKNSRVLHTCHICAGDEFRENFALVNLGQEIPSDAMEIIIPGCHSDVGGGYISKIEQDIVLYKFVPRKFEHFLKHNKLLEIIGFPYLRMKERAKMFVDSPHTNPSNNSIVEGHTKELNTNTLAELGWVGNEWRNDTTVTDFEVSYDGNVCTKRVAEWPNEIKFKRYVMKGYSNIPLRMMMKCVENCGLTWIFKDKTFPYEIPEQLKGLGEKMISKVGVPSGQRMWMIPEGNYSGSVYRKLRLNFLHFTSSCELWHFRSSVEEKRRSNKTNNKNNSKVEISTIPSDGKEEHIVEFQGGNFGNNCNYDNDAHICRIMYNGDEQLEGDHSKSVHYMYEFSNIGMRIETV